MKQFINNQSSKGSLFFIFTFLSISLVIFNLGCKRNDEVIKKKEFNFNTIKREKPTGSTIDNYCYPCGYSESDASYCENNECEICYECECGQDQVNLISNQNLLGYNLNDSIAYDIRDELLMWSEKGQMYHTYYYALSEFAISNNLITLSTVADYYSFANEIITAAHTLMDGGANDVPITSHFREVSQDFIDEFRLHSPNTTINGYLNAIEQDLEDFEGLTRSQIEVILYGQ